MTVAPYMNAREAILRCLKGGDMMTTDEVKGVIGYTYGYLRTLMLKMVREGEICVIIRTGRNLEKFGIRVKR